MSPKNARNDEDIAATTSEIVLWSDRPGLDGTMFTKGAVEGVVKDMNNADRATRGTVNHDLSCMPFRKSVGAKIIEESGDYGAEITMAFGDEYRIQSDLPDSELMLLQWKEHTKPFSRIGQQQPNDQTKVSVDHGDFRSPKQYDEFRQGVEAMEGATLGDPMGRHAVDPTPIIELVLSNPEAIAAIAGSGWFLKRVEKYATGVIDEMLARRVNPTCELIEAKLSSLRRSFSLSRGQSDEEVDLCVVMSWKDIELVLLVKASKDIEDIQLHVKELGERLDIYSTLLNGADSAVFFLGEDGAWQFEYATLNDGNVVGTLECFNRTIGQLRAIRDANMSRNDE